MRAETRIISWRPFACLLAIAGFACAADEYVIPAEKKNHWAWKAPVRSPLPKVQNESWVRNPIDRFVLAKLEAAGVLPAAPASREQLIRRVTLDLIGLPPTVKEIDEFVMESVATPQAAYEKLVDRLLASPHYGERWGRHWLDLARYAESNGYEYDEVRPNAWRYRDYVVQAFNDDKRYDRFIKEQLAGDELFPDDSQALVATGFNLLGPDMTDSSDKPQRRQNTLNDMTDTAGSVFLGLTLGCARCHDHKFEPIPQTDYYRMQAFFKPAKFRVDIPIPANDQRAALEVALKQFNATMKPLQDELAKLEAPHRKKLFETKLAKLPDDTQEAFRLSEDQRSAGQQELVDKTERQVRVSLTEIATEMSPAERTKHYQLLAQIKKLETKRPSMPTATGIQDADGQLPKTFVLERGELSNPAAEVVPGFPIVLNTNQQAVPARVETPTTKSSGRRTALANWLASEANPLTSRVMVNRIWQHHFGRGIVPSTSEFGVHGEPPTHPDLLDWLALEFIEKGWSIKQMHKLILLSSAYQQSAEIRNLKEIRNSEFGMRNEEEKEMRDAKFLALVFNPNSEFRIPNSKDPDNKLFSRMNRQRLEGEIIRDSLLAVGGRLNRKIGGPSVFPPIPTEAIQGSKSWNVSDHKQDHYRRSIYIFARRNLRFPFLETFDLADSNLSCPKRERSTTAPQALALLNATDVVEAAKTLADRLTADAKSDEERIALAYRLAFGRLPSEAEAKIGREFLLKSPLSEFCRALLNLNEFVYID